MMGFLPLHGKQCPTLAGQRASGQKAGKEKHRGSAGLARDSSTLSVATGFGAPALENRVCLVREAVGKVCPAMLVQR